MVKMALREPHDVLSDAGVTLLERGWLSANNVLIRGDQGPTALVDSGYGSHAPQTRDLLVHALAGAPLDLLLNTHLHSDHCGGNAMLQTLFPQMETFIPPGCAEAVTAWDVDALTYAATGQHCPRFRFEGMIQPGTQLRLGDLLWEVHGAKGHDPHSVVLYQRDFRLLLSADALWENGFGVVFPELEGESAFDEVGETLDLIETLGPETVIPGHGRVFQNVGQALERARSRLVQFRAHPDKHLRHALKVLIKFRLLEWQKITREALFAWAHETPYLRNAMPHHSLSENRHWLEQLLKELESVSALKLEHEWVVNR
jgi:glyoxylase-like metal-dependent hydrolase (beta-lactamase superfamily II)